MSISEIPAGEGESAKPGTRFEFTEPHMGTQFRIVLYLPDAATANGAAHAAFRRIHELDARLSDYQEDSELNQLCRKFPAGQAVSVSHDLWRILQFSQGIAQDTAGAFDVTVGPLSRLWRRARRRGELPSPESIQTSLGSVGYQSLEVADDVPRVTLRKANMQIDLGGIAKGMAADAARELLQKRGARQCLVDGGGGLALGAPPAGQKGWRVGIPVPLQTRVRGNVFILRDQSIATSGDTQQFVEVHGRRYSHLLDPRTGQAMQNRRMATVIAPHGLLADSLASALCVLPQADIPPLLARYPHVEAAVVELHDGPEPGWEGYCTAGISTLVATVDSEAREGSSTVDVTN